MLQRNSILKLLGVFLLAGLFACSGNQNKTQQEATPVQSGNVPKVEINDEAKALLKTLNEMGDYANSRNFPSMIKASSVYDELDSNILVIDLRSKEAFADGHIRNAVNVAFTDLPSYFESEINPAGYNKIVLACYAGQIASYATSLLRLAGYNNVFAMKWGMGSWNKHFSDEWFDAVSSDHQDDLELTENEKAPDADFPKMNTGKTSGEQILKARIDLLFAQGYKDVLISAEKVFEDPSEYYVINYDRKDKYDSGHIPGAVRYKPGATLGIVSEMQSIPADKNVVVYCNTGQNSGFATAYLRLFGYHARSLTYGNNSFMYNKMKEQQDSLSWIPFINEEIHDYPYVK